MTSSHANSRNNTSSGYIEQLVKFEPASPLFDLHQTFHLHLDMIVSADQDHLPVQRHFHNLIINKYIYFFRHDLHHRIQ